MPDPQQDDFEQYKVKDNTTSRGEAVKSLATSAVLGDAADPISAIAEGSAKPADEFSQYKVNPHSGEGKDSVLVKDPQTFHGHPITMGGDTIAHLPNLHDVGDLAVGAARGLGHSALGLLKMNAPYADFPEQDPSLLRPTNSAQKAGFTGEQIGEWLVPSGLEESAGTKAAELLPKFARIAKPAARVAEQAIESGARNKAQGGSFAEGAAAGALTGGLSEAGRAMAPAVAESALGIPKRARGYGKTPGRAVLDEVSGVRPETIQKNTRTVLNSLGSDINATAAAHPGTVSLQPAVNIIDNRAGKAVAQNTPGIASQLGGMRDMLTKEFKTGAPIPADVPAARALDLKRGLRKEYVGNWNPAVHAEMPGIAKQSARAIDSELDSALGPKFSALNQRYSSLQPVEEAAESHVRDPSLFQGIGARLRAKTGALAGAGVGGALGYQHGGFEGGIIGGVGGLVLPEVMSSPSVQMAAARTLNSPFIPRLARGSVLVFPRASHEEEPKEKKRSEE